MRGLNQLSLRQLLSCRNAPGHPRGGMFRGVPLDDTCILYLPFWAYGAEIGGTFPDFSQHLNDGQIIGAVPGTEYFTSPVELVTDGSFEGDGSAWTWGIGWSLDDVNDEADAVAGTGSSLRQYVGAVNGRLYKVEFEIKNYVAGVVTPWFGGNSGADASGNGVHVNYIVAGGTSLDLVKNNVFEGSIDNVSVKEVTSIIHNRGWYFDGVDDYIRVPSLDGQNFPLHGGNPFTFMAWAKSYSFDQPNAPGLTIIRLDNSNQQWLRVNYNNKWEFKIDGPSGTVLLVCSTESELNRWEFVAVSYSMGYSFLFANGEFVEDGATDVGSVDLGSSLFFIGRTVNSWSWNGLMGECVLFRRALVKEEVLNYYELTRHHYGV